MIPLVQAMADEAGAENSPERTAEPDLADLMGRYQAGDIDAFDQLYRRLAPRLRAYLGSLIWKAGLTEDLLQEVFLQLHRSRQTYMPGRAVKPWAFAIARHTYLMHVRRSMRKQKHEVEVDDEALDIPVPPEMESFATRTGVRRALRQLNDERREAVLLHHVWGFSFKEIGRILGIREGTAKLRAHRGIQSLRQILASEDEGDRG